MKDKVIRVIYSLVIGIGIGVVLMGTQTDSIFRSYQSEIKALEDTIDTNAALTCKDAEVLQILKGLTLKGGHVVDYQFNIYVNGGVRE